MHPTAHHVGRLLFQCHWTPARRRVLDIGSLDVNGSLRTICPPDAAYVGIDLEPGNGVDLVLADPYQYPFPNNHFDMIVSTSCFEHDPMFWLTFLEASRVLAEGGLLYVNAPSSGSYHRHPWDNWRFYPDASLALQMWAERNGIAMTLVESFTVSGSFPWHDYIMLFTKGGLPPGGMPFLSDHLEGVRNLRRGTEPTVIRQLHTETDDMAEIAALKARLQAVREAAG